MKKIICYFLLFAPLFVLETQGQETGSVQVDSTESVIDVAERQKALNTVFKTIENKQYDQGIAQANSILEEAILLNDTVNIRDAYKHLSKAYHFKGDIKQRDYYHKLHQEIAAAYGFHVDEGLAYVENRDDFIETKLFIVDEITLLEDKEGSYAFEEIKSKEFGNNFTVELGEELFTARLKNEAYVAPQTLLNHDAVYWIKLKVVGSVKRSDNYFFHVAAQWGASWDKVDMYVEGIEQTEHYKFGLALSPVEKDFRYNHNYFEIQLNQSEIKTIYLRLEGTRKGNNPNWRPNHVSLMFEDMSAFNEFGGYYHIPDSITHTHDYIHPRRMNHILHSLTFIEDFENNYQLEEVVNNWSELNPK